MPLLSSIIKATVDEDCSIMRLRGYHVSGKYAEIKAKAESTHSKVYHLKTTWVMLDDVKQQLILQIGTSNPKCIEEVTDKIRKMEDEQVEQYYVSCGYHTWEITRGNITRQFAAQRPRTHRINIRTTLIFR